MKITNYLLLGIISISALSCSHKVVSSVGILEPEIFPAFNKELILNIEGDSISAYTLIAQGEHKKETVILIKGYPGHDTNFDLAQDLRSQGFNVVLFNHRGAWGSEGEYSYSNCLEDVEKVVDYFKTEKNSKKFRINAKGFILIGRSLGSGIALIQGSKIDEVRKIVAISSVNYGHLMENYSSVSELSGFKKYMQNQVMINHDIDEFLSELLSKKEEFNVVNYDFKLSTKEVLLIEDSTKNRDWISKLTNVEIITMQSDHNFIDKRPQMVQEIIDWLRTDR